MLCDIHNIFARIERMESCEPHELVDFVSLKVLSTHASDLIDIAESLDRAHVVLFIRQMLASDFDTSDVEMYERVASMQSYDMSSCRPIHFVPVREIRASAEKLIRIATALHHPEVVAFVQETLTF